MNATKAVGLILVALAVFAMATPAAAQTQVFGLNIDGDIEVGGRGLPQKPSKSSDAKFEEYRDIPDGPFLQRFRLRLFRPDESYSFEFDGSKWGQQDQEFSFRTGRLGRWEFGFDWDQTPHIFSTNARMLSQELSRGLFVLPATRPALATHSAAPELDEISTRWDAARIYVRLTPTPDLDFKAEYTRIHKDGDRPMGMAFGSPANNFLEILEPIEQTIHDFRLQGIIAREQWQLQFGYTLSLFQNSLNRVVADNPCFGAVAPTGCGTDGGAAAITRGQMSLPPDNIAHTLSLAGGVNLPWWRTRVTSNFSYSLRFQDDDFLPHTINAAIVNPGLVLPKRSLEGNVQVALFNLNATSRPLPPLTLSLKYRLYNYMDLGPEMTFPTLVVNDRSTSPTRRAGRWDYMKQNTDLDARWKILQPVAFTVGAGWEHFNRNEHREVPESDEFSGKAVLDVTPFDWLLVQAKYVPSFRRINRYISHAHAEHTVEEDAAAVTQGQSVLLRKFDEGERDRQRVDLMIQLSPVEWLTFTPTASYRWDDYIRSVLGLQQETSWSAGMDVNWTPSERFSASAGYVHESNFQKMRSRNRPVVGGFGIDFADFDWISNNTDTVETYHAGVKTTLIPKVLDWIVGANYSYALGRIETRNAVGPASSTAGNNYTARAKPMPAFEDSLLRLETSLKYHFWKNWTASLGYILETFEKHDWRTDALNPFVPGVSSIWLGNDLKDYNAHIVAFTIGYRFK